MSVHLVSAGAAVRMALRTVFLFDAIGPGPAAPNAITRVVPWWCGPMVRLPVPAALTQFPVVRVVTRAEAVDQADQSFWRLYRWQWTRRRPPPFLPLAPALRELREALCGTPHALLREAIKDRSFEPVPTIIRLLPEAIEMAQRRDNAASNFVLTRRGRIIEDGSVLMGRPRAA